MVQRSVGSFSTLNILNLSNPSSLRQVSREASLEQSDQFGERHAHGISILNYRRAMLAERAVGRRILQNGHGLLGQPIDIEEVDE
jgi:hypothetical protein